MTADLVQFLRARLDEDEQTARAAHGPNWLTDGRRRVGYGLGGDDWLFDALTTADADHIGRHDPARVLAEVYAKRQIIDSYERAMANRRAHPDDLASAGAFLALHGAVKLLVLPYTDHPEWEPDQA